MERLFGADYWDIYSCHKGEWCLYRSMMCQEDSICVGCHIYKESKEKFDFLMNRSFGKKEDNT